MKKKLVSILIISTFLLIPHLIQAQQASLEEDVLYLKNGSILRGTYIPLQEVDSLRFQLLDGQVLTFAQSEIETLQREPSRFKSVRIKYEKRNWRPPFVFKKGYARKVNFGLAVGSSNSFSVASGYLEVSYGYRFHPKLRVFVGTGFHGYGDGLLVPAFVEISSRILDKRISPVVQIQAGYNFSMTTGWRNDVFEGGIMIHPSLGLSLPQRSGGAIILSVGYRHQPTFVAYTDIIWDPQTGNQIPIEVSGNQLFRRITLQFSSSL